MLNLNSKYLIALQEHIFCEDNKGTWFTSRYLHSIFIISVQNVPSVLTLKPDQCGLTRSIPWFLMPWFLVSPGHQQPWYWLYRIAWDSTDAKPNTLLAKHFEFYSITQQWHGAGCWNLPCMKIQIPLTFPSYMIISQQSQDLVHYQA